MNMRFLGKTGIKVSELSFGTMTFGVASVGQKEADVMINMALEAGINCFDSADVYSGDCLKKCWVEHWETDERM